MIVKDGKARNKTLSASKDHRPATRLLRPYPGVRVGARKSDLAEAMSNMAFVWKLNGHPSRFSDGTWPVLYTAQREATALAEVGYHLQEVYLPAKLSNVDISVPHITYRVEVHGRRRDLSFESKHLSTLCASSAGGMKTCQNLARKALSEGIAYLLAPSARDLGKRCYPILARHAVSKPIEANTLEITLVDDVNFVRVTKGSRVRTVPIARRY